jgi:hypothetical protein
LSDEDFLQSAIVPHTFYGSFELNESPATEYYKKYIGKDVYNLVNTPMLDSLTNNYTTLIRLSTFTVRKVRTVRGTNKIRLTLEGHRSHRPYSKDVEILTTNQAGNVIGNEDQTFDKIFALGDPSNMKDVRSENLNDLMKGAVKRNFTEAEVRLALGEPTGYSQLSDKEYTWNYNQPGTEYKTVIFDKKTRLVKSFQIF